MADQKLAVEIIFEAVDKASKTTQELSAAFGQLDSKAREIAEPFANFTGSLIKAETAMLALGVAMVSVAVDSAGKFGDQIAEIGTLFGGTNEQMGQFSAAVLDYGKNSTQSLESINAAIYSAISAGVKYGDSIEFINEVEKLSVAGRADLGDVTKLLTGTLNAYGESTDQAGRYSDILFTTVKQGQTTLPELASSLGQVTATAAAAGVPFEDLSAAIGVLTSSGIGTSEAISGIKAALSNIIQPSNEAAKEAERLGVGFGAAALESKGLDGLLRELMQSTGGNIEEMSKFFGSIEGLNAVMALGQNGAADFSAAIATMANSTGATNAAFQAMANNYELATQKMINAANAMMIELGQPLLDEFGSIANAIGEIFNKLGEGIDDGAFEPVIAALQAFGQSAADTLAMIAKNLPQALEGLDFSALIASLGTLGDTIGDLFERMFDNIDLETPEGLRAALQKLIDIISGLINVTSGIVQEFAPFFDVLGDLASSSAELGEEAQGSLGKFLGAMTAISNFGGVLGTLNAILVETGASMNGIGNIVVGIGTVIVNAFQVAFDTVVGVLVQFAKDFVDVMEGITPDFLGDPWKEMSEELGYILDGIGENWKRNNAEFTAGLGKIGEGLGLVGDSAAEAATDTEKLKQPLVEASEASKGFEPVDLGDIDFVAEAAKRLGISLTETKTAAEDLQGATAGLAPEWASAEEKAQGYKRIVDELGNVSYVQVGNAAREVGKTVEDSFSKQQEQIEAAAKAAQEWALKMEEIASNERIKMIEAVISLNIADLEAQTKMVEAAFDSINTTIESTGDLIGDLFGLISTASLSDKFDIWAQINLENKRRQEALDLQKKLVEAQVEYLRKRAEALARGDALIKVQADGLQPALEQIWFEIMKDIQVKAAEEGLELLLGVTS